MRKDDLRRKAEETLSLQSNGEPSLSEMTSDQIKKLFHELTVHQIELELQNEQLRQTQEALESSRDRYVDLYDFSPVGYLTLKKNGFIVEANLSACNLLGMERHALLRRPLSHFVLKDDSDLFYLHLQQEDITLPLELRLRREGGCIFPAQVDVISLPSQDGRETQFRVVLHDITERIEAEKQQQLLAKVFEVSNEGIMITDHERNIIEVNRAFCETTGYRREEVLGRNPKILQSGRHDKAFYEALRDALKTDGLWQGEIWNRWKDGDLYVEWLSIKVLKDKAGRITNYLGIFFDITDKKRSEEKMARLAHFDSLTDLPNRVLFNEELKRKIKRTAQGKQWLALFFLDLDHFKEVNDLLGHESGDELLQRVARRLKSCIRPTDTLARLSGDEFCIIVGDLFNQDLALHVTAQVIEKIKKVLSHPIELSDGTTLASVSIGIALFPKDAVDPAMLVKYADIAMYEAKEHEGTHCAFFSKQMNVALVQQLTLKKELQAGYRTDEFQLYYQPQVRLGGALDSAGDLARNLAKNPERDLKVIGFEALLRWHHPEEGLLRPDRFIHTLEMMGLINDVGEWVLRAACRQAFRWLQEGMSGFKVTVNLSVRQLLENDFPQKVAKALSDSGLPAEYLQLEVTESFMIKEPERIAGLLQEITALGVTIALDDFGTGYSSLSYLKRFPIQTLKIDQSFVRDITTDTDDATLVKTIIQMTKNLKLKVIAEGVETEAQSHFLQKHGCDNMQGNLYAKPMPAEKIETWMKAMAH